MPDGLVRTDLNTTGTSFRNGDPVQEPKNFGTPETQPPDPKNFGNVEPVVDPTLDSNPVTWAPDPKHFGNIITP